MTRRRILGLSLLLVAYAPVHRLLDPARAGPAGAATRSVAETAWVIGLAGSAIVLALAFAMARLVSGERLHGAWHALARALVRPPSAVFAAGVGCLAGLAAAGTALLVHGTMPTSVDEMAQLLHARALSEGLLTLPTLGADAALIVQNGISAGEGWASIYPPLHTLLLAAGLRLDAAWLVGPLAVALATGLCALSFERLLGPRFGRGAAALLAITPFWILLGSTHLSHSTAAAALALVLWTGLRAREGGFAWAFATGLAVGAAVTARPWIALVTAGAVLAATWTAETAPRPRGATAPGVRVAGVALGGLPFAGLLLWWNARLFGGPLTLGYSAAFGPSHGLGLHPDPWGNLYGPVEAVAYTAADLVQLGAHLLQSPLPAIALIGAGLAVARRGRFDSIFGAWVLAALGANALYWHHGSHFGPRMLYESTPAWIALFVTAAGVVGRRPEARGDGAWCVAVTLSGSLLLAPRVVADAARARVAEASALPSLPFRERAVVFVHGSWASRVGARLAATGMRRDSIETALRRNDICAVDEYARWRSRDARPDPAPALDFEPLPGSPPELQTRRLSEGNLVRVLDAARWGEACRREAESDRFGVVEIEPLAWQAPPTPASATVVVRDLGPARNAALRERLVGRWVVYLDGDGATGPTVLDYDAGMELLWRGAAGR